GGLLLARAGRDRPEHRGLAEQPVLGRLAGARRRPEHDDVVAARGVADAAELVGPRPAEPGPAHENACCSSGSVPSSCIAVAPSVAPLSCRSRYHWYQPASTSALMPMPSAFHRSSPCWRAQIVRSA